MFTFSLHLCLKQPLFCPQNSNRCSVNNTTTVILSTTQHNPTRHNCTHVCLSVSIYCTVYSCQILIIFHRFCLKVLKYQTELNVNLRNPRLTQLQSPPYIQQSTYAYMSFRAVERPIIVQHTSVNIGRCSDGGAYSNRCKRCVSKPEHLQPCISCTCYTFCPHN